MLAHKQRGLTHPLTFIRSILGVVLFVFTLPSSAVVIFDLNYLDTFSYITPTSTMQSIVITAPFPTGSSSPSLSRNLQRAHAWSSYDGQNVNYLMTTPRQTSLQSNMARAQAFRQN